MMLSKQEMLEVYEGIILPFEHPDPIGYLARALITSGADPYFYEDGLIGFMPVLPRDAFEVVGANNVASLENNLAATMAMDRLFFESSKNISLMIIAFHFDPVLSEDAFTEEHIEFLNLVDETRPEIMEYLYPRNATIEDVIQAIKSASDKIKLGNQERDFFNSLLKGKME